MSLKYSGNGRNVQNVPMHDLTDDELNALALREKMDTPDFVEMLIASGVFKKATAPRKTKVQTQSVEPVEPIDIKEEG